MSQSLQPDHAPLMRRLRKPLGAALAAALALTVLDALLRPFCAALQPVLPWIEPVAVAHGLSALMLAGIFWLMGLAPLGGLRNAAAAPRGPSAFDEAGGSWFLVLALVPVLISVVGFAKAMSLGLPLSPRPFYWLATGLLVGLAEEYAVRGPLFELMVGFGPRAAIYGTAIFFALLHVGNYGSGASALVVTGQIFGALVTGLCWSFMRWRWRTLWPAALIHGFGDFVAFVLADGTAAAVRLDPSPHAFQMRIALCLVMPLLAAGSVWLLRQSRMRAATA